MTKIRFDYGIVTISDGFVQAPSPRLTALLDTLAATLPGYGSIPFILDEDFNIAQGLIEKIGTRKIVLLDRMPPSPLDLAVSTRVAREELGVSGPTGARHRMVLLLLSFLEVSSLGTVTLCPEARQKMAKIKP